MRMYNSYSKSRLENPDARIWDTLSLGAILLCLFIFLIQWQQLPFFLDMYYHMAVAKGFEAAKGIAGHNFWEYGPKGAPHLYPPLIHLLILGLLRIGLPGITILKLLSCLMPVLFLFTIWYVVGKILTKRVAFFTVSLSLCASLFMLSASFTPAATLGMILLLVGIYQILRNRIISAILLFGMLFYTHIGIAVISMLFIILAKAANILETKKILKILTFILLIGSPWIFHIIINIPLISWQNTARMPIRLYPIILIFFIVGLSMALKKIKEYKVPVLFLLSLIPMSFFYPFRSFCAQGMVGFLLFAGIGLEKAYCLADALLRKDEASKKYTVFFLIIILFYLIFLAPSIYISKNGYNLKISDSLFTSLLEGKEKSQEYVLSTGVFSESLFNRLAEYVKNYSKKGEFLWSNNRYIAGILWTMTRRPSLSHMLLEIRSKNYRINIPDAAILLIIDEPEGEFHRIYKRVKFSFKIAKIEKTEDADIYILVNRKSQASPSQNIPKPLISTAFAFIILTVYLFSMIIIR